MPTMIERHTTMRALLVAASLALLACTDGGARPGYLELDDTAPRSEAHAGYEHRPERERLVDPRTQPRLEFVNLARTPEDYHPTEYYDCPYLVRAHAIPAATEDGAISLELSLHRSPDMDDSDERMELRWVEPHSTRVERIFDRAADRPPGGAGPGCRAVEKQVRERIAAINAELAEHVWQPIERVDPRTQPRLELKLHADCYHEVVGHDFPAVSSDGETLVQAYAPTDQFLELSWLGANATRVDRLDGGLDSDAWDLDLCAALARVRKQVAALNDELADRSWRPLEHLDAWYSEPGFSILMGNDGELDPEIVASLAGADRPIEVYYGSGSEPDSFIARVRQIEVLQSTARPEWRGPDSELCTSRPQISALYFDRRTRLGLVEYNFSSHSCMCDDRSHFARVELSDELLAAAGQRTTAAFTAAKQARLEGL